MKIKVFLLFYKDKSVKSIIDGAPCDFAKRIENEGSMFRKDFRSKISTLKDQNVSL